MKKAIRCSLWLWLILSLAAMYGGQAHYAMAQRIGGIDYFTKLMLHADGSEQGTSFTDSETKFVGVNPLGFYTMDKTTENCPTVRTGVWERGAKFS